jgi:hypothetical protein
MPKGNPDAELEQAGRSRRLGRGAPNPKPLGRTPDMRRLAQWLGRGNQQQPMRVGR